KRAYCLKTQPATGETYPKSDLFNKAVNQVKLTDKPLSFGYSVVDSHSSFCPSKSKNPPKRFFT
ncbi:hypothetical protein JZL97_18190, partial [Escherichia coli]|uniref:hypothetical protein n=1 Tax=Escherichia coli TaxID=562 RepID=UPI00197DF01E